MTRRVMPWLAILAAALSAHTATAELTVEQQRQILSDARAAYDAGVAALRTDPEQAAQSFADSARRFEQLVDDEVHNGRLHYNLANAYLQMGKVGRAIQHYRVAGTLIPGDRNLRHNLRYARTLVQSHIADSGSRALTGALLALHHNTPVRARVTVFLAAYALCWILLTVNLVAPRPRYRWPALIAAAVSIGCAGSVGADLLGAGTHRDGVVLTDDVVVRKGNSEGFEPQFLEPLHQGVEFRVLEQRTGWLSIELPDGKTGWIRADAAGVF